VKKGCQLFRGKNAPTEKILAARMRAGAVKAA